MYMQTSVHHNGSVKGPVIYSFSQVLSCCQVEQRSLYIEECGADLSINNVLSHRFHIRSACIRILHLREQSWPAFLESCMLTAQAMSELPGVSLSKIFKAKVPNLVCLSLCTARVDVCACHLLHNTAVLQLFMPVPSLWSKFLFTYCNNVHYGSYQLAFRLFSFGCITRLTFNYSIYQNLILLLCIYSAKCFCLGQKFISLLRGLEEFPLRVGYSMSVQCRVSCTCL